MVMGACMKANGKTIKLKERDSISIQTDQFMKETFRMIFKKVLE